MRQWLLLLIELALIAFATVFAAVLRGDFETPIGHLSALEPYLLMTLAVAVVVLPVLGTNRAVWRFSTVAAAVAKGAGRLPSGARRRPRRAVRFVFTSRCATRRGLRAC